MGKTLIITDTTSGFTIEEAKEYGIVLVPLSVIVNEQEYKDLYEITIEQLYEYDRQKVALSTSQPNIGYLEDILRQIKKENYDHIIVITISSTLSGSYQAFTLAAKNVGLDNITIIDSLSVGPTMKYTAILANNLAKEGKDIPSIVATINDLLANSLTFLFPSTLDNLRRGGRISETTAAMGNFLRLKPLLTVVGQKGTVDKHSVERTESKLFKVIIKEYQKFATTTKFNKMYILHSDAMETVERFIPELLKAFPNIDYEVSYLPAVLTTHVGVGAFATQVIKAYN